MSICQSLLAQVTDIAIERGAGAVEGITVEVGVLSGVEPMLLVNAFQLLRIRSCASEAVMYIERSPITVRCMSCAAQSRVERDRLICSVCGEFRTRVVSGHEWRLSGVKLAGMDPSSLMQNT
jgi:hydrogenase nickel incorporation protein HypA/HybF